MFDSLFTEGTQKSINVLLSCLIEWHFLAKLRLHTDDTLSDLEKVTVHLGRHLRHFADTVCPHFDTKETPAEQERRRRQQAKKAQIPSNRPVAVVVVTTARKAVSFNLETYKLHALGDYASDIRSFGASAGFSTQLVKSYI